MTNNRLRAVICHTDEAVAAMRENGNDQLPKKACNLTVTWL